MRAGKHDVIGARAVGRDKARRNLRRDLDIVDKLAMHEGFGDRRKAA